MIVGEDDTYRHTTRGEPYGVVIPLPVECDQPHPEIKSLRCERKRNHDGWHKAENVWWK